uniref:Uncharacterized protein n=1 Tax=Mucochytrium quahogii TaxID=96639 RepID=A0A7S2WRX2_9STRA
MVQSRILGIMGQLDATRKFARTQIAMVICLGSESSDLLFKHASAFSNFTMVSCRKSTVSSRKRARQFNCIPVLFQQARSATIIKPVQLYPGSIPTGAFCNND